MSKPWYDGLSNDQIAKAVESGTAPGSATPTGFVHVPDGFGLYLADHGIGYRVIPNDEAIGELSVVVGDLAARLDKLEEIISQVLRRLEVL